MLSLTTPDVPQWTATNLEPYSVGDGTKCLGSARDRRPSERTPEAILDSELLRRYRDCRDERAFDELVRRYAAELYRYLNRYLNGRAPAEDVLQNTFLQVHAKCGLYREGCPVRPWLYAIATHQAVDALRRAKRAYAVRFDRPHDDNEVDAHRLLVRLADENPGPFDTLQKQESCHWMRETVAALPEPSREVLVLAYYEGLKYQEIANILQVPLGTVKSRLHLAIAKLREKAAG